MTLNTFIEYINKALNYPAIKFVDVDMFINMAISELNTTLHISMPSIEKQMEIFKQYSAKEEYTEVVLKNDPLDPTYSDILCVEEGEIVPTTTPFYFNLTDRHYYVYKRATGNYERQKGFLRGIYVRDGIPEFYNSASTVSEAYWVSVEEIDDFEMSHFLPDEWVLLWMVPYACFKYTVRDGGTAQTFAEELQQGFQQLQETYNIPETVILATKSGWLAYADLTKEHLANLNIRVGTRAIYENMKHDRVSNGHYGSMYDSGGFGL